MLLAAVLLGRWGGQAPKQRLVRAGLAAMTLGFALFGVLAWRFQTTNQPLVLDASMIDLPVVSAALILATVALSLALGLAMSTVNIVSQTLLQEHTPDQLRGRVFSVQFMLNNLVGIPPMLAIGALADLIGIPQMLVGISGVILLVLGITLRMQRRTEPPATPLAQRGSAASPGRPVASDTASSDGMAAAGTNEVSGDDRPRTLRKAPLASDL
jgi:MFS family permease